MCHRGTVEYVLQTHCKPTCSLDGQHRLWCFQCFSHAHTLCPWVRTARSKAVRYGSARCKGCSWLACSCALGWTSTVTVRRKESPIPNVTIYAEQKLRLNKIYCNKLVQIVVKMILLRLQPPISIATWPDHGGAKNTAREATPMPTLWEKYKQIPRRSRLVFGVAVFTFSLAGLALESYLEPPVVSSPATKKEPR